MKIAIAYDWLNIKVGGGEQTLFEVAKLFPQADIFCLVYNAKNFDTYLGDRNIITSRLNKFPRFLKKRPNLLLPFIKKSVQYLDFSGYDLVISVSSAWVKNINVPNTTCHISYCYSPARMMWDSWPGYLNTQKFGPFKVGAITRYLVTKKISKLRLWDYYQSKNIYEFIAISKYISARIYKYYKRNSKIVYPPVKIYNLPVKKPVRDYYLCVSTLSKYKNISLVIDAFKNNGLNLVIAGSGPEQANLMQQAAAYSNISFKGRVSEQIKIELLQNAKAFIFPGLEDFGIAPVEALSVGTPVIALRGGGLLETVEDGVSGILFNTPTTKSLNEAINKLNQTKFDAKKLHNFATKFSEAKFKKEFPKTILTMYKKWKHEQRK
jgi:glycosyltransferase involved in cell wall biosynthesis